MYDIDSDDRGITELFFARPDPGNWGTVRVKFDSTCGRFDDLC